MSSAPTGRYQSRLFNFLNKQSQRLTDQYDRTIRHLKVATVWGAQILLYPIYMLVQAGLSAGRQLTQSAEAGWPQIKTLTNATDEVLPTVDTAIERVLAEINRLPLLEVQNQAIPGHENSEGQISPEAASELATQIVALTQSLTSSSISPTASSIDLNTTTSSSGIQGVATILETRALVLVTIENQILDILTPQQQKKLSSKISWEIADQRRKWRLAEASTRRFKAYPKLSALEENPRILAPVKLFWQLMAWVQTSPVAIAANLFQESTLVVATSNQHQLAQRKPEKILPQAPSALFFLDRTFAELESHQLVPGTEVVIALSERTTRSLQQNSQKLFQKLQTTFNKPTTTPPTGIQSLIYAAVDYFFGRNSTKLPGKNFAEQPTIPGKQQNLPSAQELSSLEFPQAEVDPWLTWDDLYDTPIPNQFQTTASTTIRGKSSQQLPEALNSRIPLEPENSVLGKIKRYLGWKQPPGKLSVLTPREETKATIAPAPLVVQPSSKPRTRRQKSDRLSQPATAPHTVTRRKIALPATVNSSLTNPNSSTTNGDLDAAPDWIETPATPSGYVKHPLEQLLEWLDSAMLWLEELVMKIWRSFRGR
ncbi:MAG: hypothetical protein WBG73_24230 [Coleofasciculaceae cyanobacterium]